MKEDKKVEDNAMTAGEPQAVYSRVSHEPYVSRALMDELMNQSDEAKLYIIKQLSESMRSVAKDTEGTEFSTEVEEREKQMETKRDHCRRKYHLPEGLIRHMGCIPPRTDEEREKAIEDYLMEKYGQR